MNREIFDLEITDTGFQKYTRYGMSLLSHLPEYFQEADLEVCRKLIGSIFPVKLIFEAGKYRTAVLNPALAIILQKYKHLREGKNGDIVISENISGGVPMTGELSNQTAEGMRKIFELEPLLKRENSSPYLQKIDQKPPKRAI